MSAPSSLEIGHIIPKRQPKIHLVCKVVARIEAITFRCLFAIISALLGATRPCTIAALALATFCANASDSLTMADFNHKVKLQGDGCAGGETLTNISVRVRVSEVGGMQKNTVDAMFGLNGAGKYGIMCDRRLLDWHKVFAIGSSRVGWPGSIECEKVLRLPSNGHDD